MDTHTSPTYPVTKTVLRKSFVPYVKRYLREAGYKDQLAYGDPIFTHESRPGYDATIVWEGAPWAEDFAHWFMALTNGGEWGYDWYEVEALNSYEVSFRKVVDGNG